MFDCYVTKLDVRQSDYRFADRNKLYEVPNLPYVTPPDCNKVENGYKTLENPIGVTVATFTAYSKIVILQFYKDCSII